MDGGVGGEGCEGCEDLGALRYGLNDYEGIIESRVFTTSPVEPTRAADESPSAMTQAVFRLTVIDRY